MRCTYCQAENADGAKFCKSCGKPLAAPPAEGGLVCPRCKAGNDAGARFCKACGSALYAVVPDPGGEETLLHVPAAAGVVPPAAQSVPEQSMVRDLCRDGPEAGGEETLLHIPADSGVVASVALPRPASVKPPGNFEPPQEPPRAVERGRQSPSRAGLWLLLVLLLVLLVAVAGGGVWYFLLRTPPTKTGTAVLESPRETAAQTLEEQQLGDGDAKAGEASPASAQGQDQQSAAQDAGAAGDTKVLPGATTETTAETTTTTAVTTILPERVAKEKPAPRRERTPTARRSEPRQSLPPPPPPPPPYSAQQPLPLASWLVDLRAELGRCSGKNAISRSICEDRARNRYCPGNWGRVRECVRQQTQPPDFVAP